MQLLDSPNVKLTELPELLKVSLNDIINNLQIQSSTCISHPLYKPLEVPEAAVPRFQNLSTELQEKFITLQLRSFLYGIYYNGSLKQTLAIDADTTKLELQNLENNTYLGVDIGFCDQLHQSNNGEGYFSPDWLVIREEIDGALAVQKGGLTLHIERDKHLQFQDTNVEPGRTIAIKMPKNLMQNGFYMAIGNIGAHSDGDIVRVYFNLTADGAVEVMHSLTSQLNTIAIPFSFKALYNPKDYNRYDSAVLYFDKSNYSLIHPILERVYIQHREHFQPEVPLFTKTLALGIAIAEEPDCKFSDKESFGMNRCQIIANGLLDAWHQGDNSPENRLEAIMNNFSSLNIELQRPYLNANSQDIYIALDI